MGARPNWFFIRAPDFSAVCWVGGEVGERVWLIWLGGAARWCWFGGGCGGGWWARCVGWFACLLAGLLGFCDHVFEVFLALGILVSGALADGDVWCRRDAGG